MNKHIQQMAPWFDDAEKRSILEYLDSGGWFTEFKKTAEFEAAICEYTGAKHCVVVNNGTVALTLAALATGIAPGDEVVVPNYSMIATANAIRLFGAVPVFVDVESTTLCLDYNQTERVIGESTRGIILVAANGRYPERDISLYQDLADRHGLILIEDAAQAMGSRYPNGRHIGTVGRVGTFSFSAPKVISTGQGGAVVTDDDAVAERLRRLKDFGRTGGGQDIHHHMGYNFKFTDLQACVGIEQMKKLPWRVERKREIMTRYRKELHDIRQITFFKQDLRHTTPWFIDIMAENRQDLMAHLRERGISTRVMYPPMNKQKIYDLPGDYPVSNAIGESGLWLPSASQLKDEDVVRVASAIRDFYPY
jgi:perosamine synthetase